MRTFKPYSALALASGGLFLTAMGVYFMLIRPPLLQEDLRYIGTNPEKVNAGIPGLTGWLQKVFLVLGGYIFTTGILTAFIAFTSFRKRIPWAFEIVVFTGMSSIGLMTVVNFMIVSDFRWVLLTFTMLWVIALILYRLHK